MKNHFLKHPNLKKITSAYFLSKILVKKFIIEVIFSSLRLDKL